MKSGTTNNVHKLHPERCNTTTPPNDHKNDQHAVTIFIYDLRVALAGGKIGKLGSDYLNNKHIYNTSNEVPRL